MKGMFMRLTVLFLILFPFFIAHSQVVLPRLVSDGMVLQRDTPLTLWGWASPNEKVEIQFNGNAYHSTTGRDGKWVVTLPKMPAGGPYAMDIRASNHIVIRNILVGDVWICSGQSNMELPIHRVEVAYPGLVEKAHNPNIRHFAVSTTYRFEDEAEDFQSGEWQETTPENIRNFSAVGYFFAKALYDKYQVPIGLIRIAVGGSPAEAWLSEETIKKYPEYFETLTLYKDGAVVDSIIERDRKIVGDWNKNVDENDLGRTESIQWIDNTYIFSAWETMEVPGLWDDNPFDMNEQERHETVAGTATTNGVIWFKKEVNIAKELLGQPAMLVLGALVDRDEVYVNGKFVGSTGYQYPPRRYALPEGVLKEGNNIITIRLVSNTGRGGFVPDKFYGLVVGDDTLNLQGTWQYKVGYASKPMPGGQVTFHYQPSGLYNAMVAPALNYKIKGAIWYQGESNTDDPEEYVQLMKDMINDWRRNFNQGDFPFLFVQLANFMSVRDQPMESNWAALREAQLKTLEIPNTGMAVAIDIGEWNDIHPLNKKDVGERLALAAQKVAYGDKKVVHSGPIYKSMKVKGNRVILSFEEIGSGLVAKGGEPLKQFAIASKDKQFVWAEAKIEGNTVVVWSDEVDKPVAVRYAWADNPEGANLYNKEGLPASPFRTDTSVGGR